MKRIALVAACALALGGCASNGARPTPQKTVASARLKQADMAVSETRARGALWLATPHLLAIAHKADAKGLYATAIKDANAVIMQCQTAQKQAAANAHVKPYYPD